MDRLMIRVSGQAADRAAGAPFIRPATSACVSDAWIWQKGFGSLICVR
jgi:hypothetical protein